MHILQRHRRPCSSAFRSFIRRTKYLAALPYDGVDKAGVPFGVLYIAKDFAGELNFYSWHLIQTKLRHPVE